MGQDVSKAQSKHDQNLKAEETFGTEAKSSNRFNRKTQKRKSSQNLDASADHHDLSKAISPKTTKPNQEQSKENRMVVNTNSHFKSKSSSKSKTSSNSKLCPPLEPSCLYRTPKLATRKQHVFIMRHGERMDHADSTWTETSPRPWDPPLTDLGRWQAYQVGLRLKKEGWKVSRIVTSPFLRCVETSTELSAALESEQEETKMNDAMDSVKVKAKVKPTISMVRAQNVQRHMKDIWNARKPKIDTRFNIPNEMMQDDDGVHLSLDYGLCEAMTSKIDPIENRWFHEDEDLEAILSLKAKVDRPPLAVRTMPHWPENIMEAISRLMHAVDRISNEFPDENLVLVTHAEAVHASVARFKKARVYNICFGGFTHLKRTVTRGASDSDLAFGPWSLLTTCGASGVFF